MRSTTVNAYPRLHFGLCDLGKVTLRAYGGAGLSISGPVVQVSVCESDTLQLNACSLDARDRDDVLSAMQRMRRKFCLPPVSLLLHQTPPQHVGLGSKTSLILASLVAYSINFDLDIPKTTLQQLSGRGGASGVGLHAFFSGGFVIDAGHAQSSCRLLGPSSSLRPSGIPTLLVRLEVPAAWQVYLVLPSGVRRFGGNELKFFTENTPIAEAEVLRTLAILYHGIAPAIANSDIDALRESLALLWPAIEILIHVL